MRVLSTGMSYRMWHASKQDLFIVEKVATQSHYG